jgi:hypothetical protein
VTFEIRTAASEAELARAKWTGPHGEGTFYQRSGAALNAPAGHAWIQYRAVLASPRAAAAPTLEKVAITFD